MALNYWTTTNTTTSSGISTSIYDDYMKTLWQPKIVYNNIPVKPEIAYKFPFKKSKIKGLPDQLQGDFDKWIGDIRKDIFK